MSVSQRPLLLHLDSSPRLQQSFSRRLTQRFVDTWEQANPNSRILYRDIGRFPVPHIDELWAAAYEAEPTSRTPEMQAALTLSDRFINELVTAERYVFGIPMYNLTIPSSFKAYIDQIVRRDRTVSFQTGNPEGALKNKKLLVITTRKFSYRSDSGRAERDFQEPYLRSIFAILGVTDITFVHADHLAAEVDIQQRFLAEAEQTLDALALQW
ncbi:FMN-dependent NADH-azoreductase [Leptolyngbya sp. NK1-12]|uniref:FMN dependent NADH:quinone oxidoreductase n=1 Tax=Leptolyngbya sp. NK1-12 TaxID=2547451 RepID=A0AA96WB40_9CYAN|nr:FMN-dependent NADH-azoreductase [Leptolyngbya sp. NK1-12]